MPPKKCKFCKKILDNIYYTITRSPSSYKTVEACSHCKFIFDVHFAEYKRDVILNNINRIYEFIRFADGDYDFKIKKVNKN